MLDLPADGAIVAPVLTAAVLLVAIPMIERLGLAHPTASAVIDATGASRSHAYALRERVVDVLATVMRPVGRPSKPAAEPVDTGAIVRAVRDFAFDHPGAVSGNGTRRRYSDAFRHVVLDLAASHRDVPLDAIAEAVGVPEGTLRDWLAGGIEAAKKGENLAAIRSRDPTEPQIATLLDQWSRWIGPFSKFCEDIATHWRLPFGRTLIADILQLHGVRFAKRRSGRSPDEDALRKQFITYFPNAQWVGDGSPIDVTVGDDTFTFNVELMVDPCSGAVVGASVRDEEDSKAVVEAFADSVATTGERPIAVLLDNKPCNHTDEVKAGVVSACSDRRCQTWSWSALRPPTTSLAPSATRASRRWPSAAAWNRCRICGLAASGSRTSGSTPFWPPTRLASPTSTWGAISSPTTAYGGSSRPR